MVRGIFQATAETCLLLEAPGDKRRNDRYKIPLPYADLRLTGTEGTVRRYGRVRRVREGTDGRVREGSGKGLPIGFERVREGTRGSGF